MKIYKVYYTATVGAVYIKAENVDEAFEKLDDAFKMATVPNAFEDTRDVKFDFWVEMGDQPVHDVSADDVEELTGSEEHSADLGMFGPKEG